MKPLLFILLTSITLAQQATPVSVGSFFFAQTNDAMTDVQRSVIYTPEIQGPAGRTGVLRIICDGDQFYAGVFADTFLNNDIYTDVTYRLDKLEPKVIPGVILTEGTEAGFLNNYAHDFVAQMSGKKSVAFRLYDYRGTESTYQFDISDSEAALAKLPCVP